VTRRPVWRLRWWRLVRRREQSWRLWWQLATSPRFLRLAICAQVFVWLLGVDHSVALKFSRWAGLDKVPRT